MRGDSTTALAPGFRFHPTDEELVSYYLKRKVSGRPFRIDAISDVDVYKCEPWDLPDKSRLKSRDLEWYFFSALDKKYGNGSRTNRATEKGYWKTTGKDRPVRRGPRTVGMKKTLVYHLGRAPRGERSNWVMHEYKLVDEELEKAAPSQDAFVVCRIFRKSGTGPKNGEHYGAPFVEEEWDNDDDLALVPGAAYVDELALADDVFVEVEDLNQELDVAVLPENLPLNAHHGDGSNSVDDSRDLFQNNEEPFMGTVGNYLDSELPGGQKLFDLPIQDDNGAYPVKYEYFVEQNDSVNPEDVNYLLDEPYLDDTANLPEMDVKSDKNEYFIEHSDNMNPVEASYLPDEPYLDATNNILLDDGLFLETNDLSNPVEVDDSGLDILQEYLTCIDAEDGIVNPAALENSITRQSFLNQEGPMNAQTEAGSVASHQPLKPQYNDGASTSEQNQESEGFNSDIKSPLIRKASCMLESISAPSTFASELPSKDVIRRLHSAARSSSPVHVTAGMIQIPDSTVSGLKMKWSFDKNGNLNFILSFVLPQVDMEPAASFRPAKVVSAMPWAAFYIIFVLALLLTVCYKFGTCICTR